ncbi:BA14K-like protein [Hoeflea marina]|uniref:Lectin-like protein BA14k n=1 Tax=Hoeflea marina TaxID=274592 RepID=A0A317PHP0_9HYPH|nr:BA14K family protein [Hoeflea marina]PWV99952.1 BA14K-like protein [Hoeflea marina]
MTKLRTTILLSLAAFTLAGTMQPSQAGNGWGPGDFKPGIHKPFKPGFKAPGPKGPGPKKPHHHHDNNFEGAALGLLGGMIIGSAIANAQQQPVYVDSGNAHVAWCIDRYRSYDIPSDTYMSNSGYRKYCNSPYR